MPDFDLLFHGRSPDGDRLSLGVSGGIVQAAGPAVSGSAAETIDFGSKFIIPGWIDAHVHFNEPGRADWEGISTGSRALAAGGGTMFIDMPLNSSPPVTTAAMLEEKRRIAEATSCLDFALWGGLIPSSLPHLEPMAAAGAVGFKAFMCHSGLDEFPAADIATLREGMKIARSLGLPVALHAELPFEVAVRSRDMASWIASRPIDFELEAIRVALDLAGETGCAIHIVHVTCPEGIDLVTDAKRRGVNVTVETCPHYLVLTDRDAMRIGPAAKCAPPLRDAVAVRDLWRKVMSGEIDTIGSDHSPAPPGLKQGDDFFAIWGGIAGIQHGLPLLLDRSFAVVPLMSRNVAARLRLGGKGLLEPGYDADFSVVASYNEKAIDAADLLTRHPVSPYLGMKPKFSVVQTWLRGAPVTPETRGLFIRPNPL
jgi:allantoinase